MWLLGTPVQFCYWSNCGSSHTQIIRIWYLSECADLPIGAANLATIRKSEHAPNRKTELGTIEQNRIWGLDFRRTSRTLLGSENAALIPNANGSAAIQICGHGPDRKMHVQSRSTNIRVLPNALYKPTSHRKIIFLHAGYIAVHFQCHWHSAPWFLCSPIPKQTTL